MTNDPQDGWHLVPWRDRLIQASEQEIWCRGRWGEPLDQNRDGVWIHTLAGYSFKNENDHMEFMLRWA